MEIFKEKYERIKILERKCTELEPEGMKVKNQLTTLRMKMLQETNQNLNRNKKKNEKEFVEKFEELGRKKQDINHKEMPNQDQICYCSL